MPKINANIQAYKQGSGVKEQVINDLGWAISSGYTAGSKAAEYIDGL